MKKLNEEQIRALRECLKATDHKIGLRVSFWPGCKSLECRGLVEKKGRNVHRLYFITEAGRNELAAIDAALKGVE